MARGDFEVRIRDGHRREQLFDAESLEELGLLALEKDGFDVEGLLEDSDE